MWCIWGGKWIIGFCSFNKFFFSHDECRVNASLFLSLLHLRANTFTPFSQCYCVAAVKTLHSENTKPNPSNTFTANTRAVIFCATLSFQYEWIIKRYFILRCDCIACIGFRSQSMWWWWWWLTFNLFGWPLEWSFIKENWIDFIVLIIDPISFLWCCIYS